MRKEKRSRTEMKMDLNRHYEEMEIHVDKDARETFKRKAYESINVAEYIRRKYGIRGDGCGQEKIGKIHKK